MGESADSKGLRRTTNGRSLALGAKARSSWPTVPRFCLLLHFIQWEVPAVPRTPGCTAHGSSGADIKAQSTLQAWGELPRRISPVLALRSDRAHSDHAFWTGALCEDQ